MVQPHFLVGSLDVYIYIYIYIHTYIHTLCARCRAEGTNVSGTWVC